MQSSVKEWNNYNLIIQYNLDNTFVKIWQNPWVWKINQRVQVLKGLNGLQLVLGSSFKILI